MSPLSRSMGKIEAALKELERKTLQYPLEFILVKAFLFFVAFHLVVFYVIFPIEEYSVTPQVFVGLPIKMQASKTKKTIQDRFRYTQKDLEKQLDPETVDIIRRRWLHPPPNATFEFTENLIFSRGGKMLSAKMHLVIEMRELVYQVLPQERNGFYVEYVAYDGLIESPTVHFEVGLNWTGVLIEPDPYYFQLVKELNRKAWITNACVSVHPQMETRKMQRFGQKDRSVMADFVNTTDPDDRYQPTLIFTAQCFPLTSILLAANVTTVNYMHLEVEGGTVLHILKTFMWHVIHVKVISIIESNLYSSTSESFQTILEKHGYVNRGIIPGKRHPAIAYVFVHEKYLK